MNSTPNPRPGSVEALVRRSPPLNRAREIATEVEVIWLEPIDGYLYVREEILAAFGPSRGRPRCKVDGRLIGYTTLGGRKRGLQFRRLFVLRDYDQGEPGCISRPGDFWNCPGEAVDPSSIAPGIPGRQTAHCWWGARPNE